MTLHWHDTYRHKRKEKKQSPERQLPLSLPHPIMSHTHQKRANRKNTSDPQILLSREKQYKDRLATWHVRKNIKAKEVHVMLRKQQKRAAEGKQTAFRVGGQEVDAKRINRFVRRYGASWNSGNNNVDSTSPEPGMYFPSLLACLFCWLAGCGGRKATMLESKEMKLIWDLQIPRPI